MREIIIHSPRLTLKPFIASDATESYACITPTLTRFMSWEPPRDHEEYQSIWQIWLEHIVQGTAYHFVIRNKANGEFLGLGGFHDVQSDTPELGIWIREDQHGFGYGREAVTAIFGWASHTFSNQHYIYPVALENYASRKIAESLNGIETYCSMTPKYHSITYFIPSRKM